MSVFFDDNPAHKIVVNKFLKSIGKTEFTELFKEKVNKKKKIKRETLLTLMK